MKFEIYAKFARACDTWLYLLVDFRIYINGYHALVFNFKKLQRMNKKIRGSVLFNFNLIGFL